MPPKADRETWITGIGLLSCLGEGAAAHWQHLRAPRPLADSTGFAPYVVHPLAPVVFDRQIPKKGDQRQMEPWQRIGTYAAGLALEFAGLKDQAELLARTDMIVAAGGGERDLLVDQAILNGLAGALAPASFLNERLMRDLRPTLFLAQLSNLLAGNISIVHGVTGSSRTFMGEEAAGVDAARIAQARIGAAQSELALVGGAHNFERQDMLMPFALGGFLLKDDYRPVFERAERPGFAAGSLGAFVVMEAGEHASARRSRPLARLTAVLSERADRSRPGAITDMLSRLFSQLAPRLERRHVAIFSGATGCEPATREERAFLAEHGDIPVRATGSHLGHALEPQFAMNIALAALSISHGRLFAPARGSAMEQEMREPLKQAVVTSVGHWRGEGMALLEAVP